MVSLTFLFIQFPGWDMYVVPSLLLAGIMKQGHSCLDICCAHALVYLSDNLLPEARLGLWVCTFLGVSVKMLLLPLWTAPDVLNIPHSFQCIKRNAH